MAASKVNMAMPGADRLIFVDSARAEEHMNAHAKWRIPSNNDGGVLTLIDAILAAR